MGSDEEGTVAYAGGPTTAAGGRGGLIFSAQPRVTISLVARGLKFDPHTEGLKPVRKISEMLFREDFSWRHQRSVVAAFDCHQGATSGNNRFAGTHISLK